MNFFLDLLQSVTIAKLICAGNIGSNFKFFCVENNFGDVANNLREFLAERRNFFRIFKGVESPFRFNFCAVGKNIFKRAEFFNQSRCAFLPDALDAGDIIGRVAAQSFEVDKQRRRETVFLKKFFLVVNLNVGFFVQKNSRIGID